MKPQTLLLPLLPFLLSLTSALPTAEAEAEAIAEPNADAAAAADGYSANPDLGPILTTRATSCKVPVDWGIDKKGTCVDTTKKNSCVSGLLVTGHCPGAYSNICCIPNDCFTPEKRKREE